jgi:hypothetical protein
VVAVGVQRVVANSCRRTGRVLVRLGRCVSEIDTSPVQVLLLLLLLLFLVAMAAAAAVASSRN